MKCKGIVAVGKNDPRLIDVEVPQPGPHEIQVRFRSTLVSVGTERARVLGLPNAETPFPFAPGYCDAGVVECVGSEVTRFRPGDRVAAYAIDMGHREIGNVWEQRAVHIPEGVSFDQAAFTSLGQTAMQGVRKCRIEMGESVVSLGLGIVGLLALELARVCGAIPVIGVNRSEARLEIARACGADAVISNAREGWQEELRDLTGGKGPNVVIDSTGVPAAMETACQMAADYARVCILGCPRGTVDFNFYRDIQKKSITVISAHAVDSVPLEHSYPNYWTYIDDADCFLKYVKRGDVRLEAMIDRIVEKDEAETSYRDLILGRSNTLSMILHW